MNNNHNNNLPNDEELNPWSVINIKEWEKTPVISDRIATKEDVKKGIAVFYIPSDGIEHSTYTLQLPKLAFIINTDEGEDKLVVVIQIENVQSSTIVGYRGLVGGNGVCMLNELRFLSDVEIISMVKESSAIR
ncbi:MAG: hypothetical protein JNJ85_09580 [Candidatus Kapabacteria bacterium]|nr:hypothetical protein [Candidatus Kapabacteria bacterium]